MEINSITTISQVIVKSVASPLLIFIGYSTLGAVLGYTISFLAATILKPSSAILTIIRKLKAKNPIKTISILETLRRMLHYGVPLSISSIISGFLIQFYTFTMAIYGTEAMVGNYQIAVQFATILTFFTIPISTLLFPAFSKINPKNEPELLQTVFASSVKYASMILIPAAMAIMILSKPMIGTLFGEKCTYAPFFLTLYVISNLFVIFGHLILGSLLAGLGETKTQMKLSLINLAFGIPLTFLLIPSIGIVRLILTSLMASISSIFIGLYWIWNGYKVILDIKSSIKIFTASTVAALTILLVINLVAYKDRVELIAGSTIFLTTYLIATPFIGAVNQTDIKNIKIISSNARLISLVLKIPLNIMEKIAENLFKNTRIEKNKNLLVQNSTKNL